MNQGAIDRLERIDALRAELADVEKRLEEELGMEQIINIGVPIEIANKHPRKYMHKKKKEKPEKPAGGGRTFTTKTCCGSKGARHFKTCPTLARGTSAPAASVAKEDVETGGDTNAAGFGVPSSNRVKELLRGGHSDEFISGETGAKIRTVAFIRKAMKNKGELV